MHAGFVGHGMLDAACPGEVFTSPTPDQMIAAAEALSGNGGVLFIVKNYSGDVMNFEMAAEMLDAPNASVLTNDDVAVEDSTFTQGRRGVAGTVVVEKIVGAAAEAGMDLAGCQALGVKVNKATGSMGVALTSCTVPAAGRPTFDISDKEMEIGVGIHGEPGRRRVPLASANEIVKEMMDAVFGDLSPSKGEDILLFVNGMGAAKYCAAAGVTASRSLVGNYCTSLDMAGCSVTMTRLDSEMTALWDAPVHTASMRWGM